MDDTVTLETALASFEAAVKAWPQDEASRFQIRQVSYLSIYLSTYYGARYSYICLCSLSIYLLPWYSYI